MFKPLVTVITPTYNRSYMISTTIESVLSQTYSHFEYIIIDDGSNDDTEKLVTTYGDRRIHYIRHPKNMGVQIARNTALDVAKGEWIAYIDDDNELFPNHLEVMIKSVQGKKDVVFVMSRGERTIELYQNNTLVKEIDNFSNFPDKMTTQDIAFKKFYFDINGFFHSRKVIDDGIRFDPSPLTGTMEDWEFALQLCEKYPQGLLYIKDILFHYHQRYGGDGRVANDTYESTINAFEYIYQKHKNDKILIGQPWYPERIEKYKKLQKEYEEGKAPPKSLLPFV